MSSKLSLKNKQGELSIVHKDGQPAKTIYTDGLTIAVDTIEDMEALIVGTDTSAYDGTTVSVKDLDRGGYFIYDSTKVSEDNQGTNFKGFVRQYEGTVSPNWFKPALPSYKDSDILSKTLTSQGFDLEQNPGKGNMQGITIVGNKLYAIKNIKDNSNNQPSYSPEENGRVYEFDINDDLSSISYVNKYDVDKFAHQGFSHFMDGNDVYFVSSNGTPDDETSEDIVEYSGHVYTDVYANSGKGIRIWKLGDNSTTEIKLVDDYDSSNIATKWYHSTPYITPDKKTLVVVFSDIMYSPRKLVRLYDATDILNNNVSLKNEFLVKLEDISPTESKAFQGCAYDVIRDEVLLNFGDWNPTYSKNIYRYTSSGSFIEVINYYPKLNSTDYTTLEVEGFTFFNGKIISALNTRNTNGDYAEYLLTHGIGTNQSVKGDEAPSKYFSSNAIDFCIKEGQTFKLATWDKENESSELIVNFTSYGNPQFKGSYLAMQATYDNPTAFKPLAYDTDSNRQLLQIRGWGTALSEGSGINLYGNNDAIVSGADIHFFGNNFKFKNQDIDASTENIAMITSSGNLRLRNYLGLDYSPDGETYNKVLNRTLDGILEIRAKNNLEKGAGINLYDEDHDTKKNYIVIYVQNSADNKGQLILDDIPDGDPSVAGAVYKEDGALKISNG